MKYTPLFLDKLRSGDQKSFEKLYYDLFPALVVFAKKYMKEDGLSEDIVQEVFINLWNKLSTINIRMSIKSYLYVAVRNHAINSLNKKSLAQNTIYSEKCMEITSCEEYEMLAQDVYHHIHCAIENLPQKSREVIIMSMSDMSLNEIQEELSVSINTVKTNKKRAYQKLRKSLRNLREL